MSHVINEAKELLSRLKTIQLMPVRAKVADNILVMPTVIDRLEKLINCAEILKNKDKQILSHRQDLLSAIQALRIDVWQINDHVARVTGHSQSDLHVPVKPLTLSIRNIMKLCDSMQALIEEKDQC